MDQVAEIRPGSVIDVQILRNEKKMTLPVTIQEFPEVTAPATTTP